MNSFVNIVSGTSLVDQHRERSKKFLVSVWCLLRESTRETKENLGYERDDPQITVQKPVGRILLI